MRLTPKEVVAYLATHSIHIDADTVRAWCNRGLRKPRSRGGRHVLKSVRVGGRILILQTAVESFIPHLSHVQE